LALYSIKTDGTRKTKLIDNGVRPFAVEEWIYFNNAQGDLFRIKVDGKEYSKVAENAGVEYASGEWLYYCIVTPENKSENKVTLCKIKPDGTEKSDITTLNGIGAFCFDNGLFYYTTSEKRLYGIKLDGIEKAKLNDINISFLIAVSGDWMYIVSSDISGEATYRVKLDGSVGVQLKEVK
jgi:hypothetical protein